VAPRKWTSTRLQRDVKYASLRGVGEGGLKLPRKTKLDFDRVKKGDAENKTICANRFERRNRNLQ